MAKKKTRSKKSRSKGSTRESKRSKTTPARAPATPEPSPGRSPIDKYLAKLPDDQRASLESLRRQILGVAKGAEERLSYQIAAFRYAGRMLVGFGATKNHCTFYLMSNGVPTRFAAELAPYQTGKGSIRFQPSRPLPAALVRTLVRARIQENARAN